MESRHVESSHLHDPMPRSSADHVWFGALVYDCSQWAQPTDGEKVTKSLGL